MLKEGLVNKLDLVDTIHAHFVSAAYIKATGVTLVQLRCACSVKPKDLDGFYSL